MKKTFLFSVLLCLAGLFSFVACEHEEEKNTLNVSPPEITFSSQGEAKNITISSNTDWNIEPESLNWLDISLTSGNGAATVTLTTVENSSTVTHSATLTVTAGDKTATVAVSQRGVSPPPQATISGDDSNCPQGTSSVTLTASATGATSYVWYNGENVIPDKTASTMAVTTRGRNTYYAAGVNEVGEGPKSAAKVVTIYDECTFDYEDLLGNYTATGSPRSLTNPDPSAWSGQIIQPEGGNTPPTRYEITNYGNRDFSIYIDIVGNELQVVQRILGTVEGGGGAIYDALLVAYYRLGNTFYYIEDYPVQWDPITQQINFGGRTDNGQDVLIGVIAVDDDEIPKGYVTEGYANLVITVGSSLGTPIVSETPSPKRETTAAGIIPFETDIKEVKMVKYDSIKFLEK